MNKIVLRNGLIAGGIFVVEMAAMVPLMRGGLDLKNGYIVGYSSMILAFLLVYFGVRSYREQAGGSISFGKAFSVGLAITLIACAFYVLSWEVVYFNFLPDFADKYSASVMEKTRKDGASEAKIEATKKQMADFKRLYANPVINAGMTLMEVFPVGLVVTLVSAAILRKKQGSAAPAAAATAIA
jgi:hypothetical protein